ncbi:MAG: EamA family transporter [archaeon]
MEWYILALISAVLSAIAAVAEKKSLFKTDALEFSFILSIFTLIFSLPFIFLVDITKVTALALAILFIKSLLNAIAFYSVMSALKRLDISKSLPLMDLSPGLVAIIAFIFLGEKLNLMQSLGLILLIVGTYIINLKEKDTPLGPFAVFIKSKGHNYILLALASFTITSVLDKVLVGNFKMAPESFMIFQHVFTFFIFLAAVVLGRNLKKYSKNIFTKSTLLILFVGIITIGYRYAQILAVKTGKVALVLAIKRISVFIAIIIGGKLFKEKKIMKSLGATAILIAGIILVTYF